MATYEFIEKLIKNKFLSEIWSYLIDTLQPCISSKEKAEIISLLAIYFSFIDEGSTCLKLDKKYLIDKWNKKCDGMIVLSETEKDLNVHEIGEIKSEGIYVIDNNLDDLSSKGVENIISNNLTTPFIIKNGWLYTRKYYQSKYGIEESIKRLFVANKYKSSKPFDYKSILKDSDSGENPYGLSQGQEEALTKGLLQNEIITGGPGTGKTTSIIFLLYALLNEPEYKDSSIFMTAPSGKAASRMKESILESIDTLIDLKKANAEIIEKIKSSQEYTIHRLLQLDRDTNDFKYNSKYQLPKKSIVVVDEASMADICIFDAVLQAIPDDSRVFIMGDKNQLPSVESGAVLADLLTQDYLKPMIVEIKVSQRFKEGSVIHNLATAINEGKTEDIDVGEWLDCDSFDIQPIKRGEYPVFPYLNNDESKEKENIKKCLEKWSDEFYKNLQEHSTNIKPEIDTLNALFEECEKAKILCAENHGVRGVIPINQFIKNRVLKNREDYGAYAPGELLMVTQNDKSLNLYNGDSGVAVKFENDNNIYFMTQKHLDEITEDGKKDGEIFKIGKYIFYPINLISTRNISDAYAISIHKSQGSGYKNIMVIIPTKNGHPLLCRQIIYTAITRTKGNTYIISSLDKLKEATVNKITRDTNIEL